MSGRKFAHGALFCISKSRIRVQCKCGKMSPWFDGESRLEDAEVWHRRHTGLNEVKPTQRSGL
jgi:hypothetical protein